MFNLGWTEVVIILGVAVLIFGPKKIPELGSSLGKTLRGFKDEMSGNGEADDIELYEDEADGDDYR
ncbi:twin-arginine translocase TatA/TatE family subunit [filamentous cyanobacterium CCP5]|nr:twin-arginine translocase TatA/TatE family subunit [filamentous cyanobacterium CCP5]